VTERLRVDMADLTFEELAVAGELVGVPLHELMGGPGHFRYVAAVVCVTMRRTDPDFSLEQAMRMRPADVELVDSSSSEQSAGSNGAGPALLPAAGS
jgi:hypothetical protein